MTIAVESSLFGRLDPAYARFTDQLRTSNVKLSSELGTAFRRTSDIGRIALQPDALELPAKGKRTPRVHASTICHHGMLSILSSSFGNDLVGRPRLYLFAKALAHCLDFYFMLCIESNRRSCRAPAAFVRDLEKKYSQASAVTRRPWRRLLRRASRDPFRSYKEATHELFFYSSILLSSPKGNARDEAVDRIRRLHYLVYFTHVDVSMDVLFATSHFGTAAADETELSSLMGALDRSPTLIDFLDTLQPRSRSRRRGARSSRPTLIRAWL